MQYKEIEMGEMRIIFRVQTNGLDFESLMKHTNLLLEQQTEMIEAA